MADELNVKFGGETSELDAATDRAKQDVTSFQDVVTSLQDKLAGLGDRLSSAFSNFRLGGPSSQVSQFGSTLGGASGEAASFGAVATVAVAAVAGALVIGTQRLIEFGRQHSEVAQQINNMAQQTGLSVTEVSRWQAITASAGVSSSSLSTAINQLSRNLAAARSGAKEQSEAFAELGINTNEAMTQQQLLLAVADRFRVMPDGPEKTAMAMRLLGRSGTELIPVLNAGSAALIAQGQAASESGAAITDAYVQAGLQVNDSLNQMDQATQGLSNTLFTALSPAITATAQGLADFVTDMTAAFQAGGDLHGIIQVLDVVFRAIAIVVGAAGVVLSDIFAAAMIVCIPLANALAANVIALKRAFEGDFAGAARAYSEAAQRSMQGIQQQIQRAQQVQEHYNQFVRNQVNGNNGRAPSAGLDPSEAQAGADIISRIRAQQAADAQRIADQQARREASQRNAAARAAHRAAEQELQAHIAMLSAEQEADRDNYSQVMQLENQKLEALRAFYGENSRQYQAEVRRREQMERQHQQLMTRIEQDRIQSHARIEENIAQVDLSIGQQRLAAEQNRIEMLRQIGAISEQTRIAMLRRVTQQEQNLESESEQRIYDIHLNGLRAQLADQDLRVQDRERILRQIEELEASHQQRVRQLQETASQNATNSQRQAAQASAQSWQQALQPVGNALNGMFQNLYNGTMTFKQALLQSLDQILFSFVQKGIEMAVNWAANQLAMTAATTAGVTARVAAEETGAATGMAIQGGTALGQIMNSAWAAMAGAYSAIAGIPYVGPFLAPVVAAGIFAAVAGLAGSVVSSAGGLGEVEKDGQMAMLHKKETVLPASMAVPLRDMLANWDVGQSSAGMRAQASNGTPAGGNYVGGDTNLTYAPSNQVGGGNLETMLKRDSIGMRRFLKNEARNGRLRL